MFLDNFPKVVWINLERCVERKNIMEDLLKSHNIENIRIDAIDGNNNDLYSICIPNSKLSLAENACTCSHLKALKYFVDQTSEDRIIIFEDDVSFEFLEYIPYNWSVFEEKLPDDYEIVQLAVSRLRGIDAPHLVKVTSEMGYYCSAAYLIKRNAAIKLIKKYYCDGVINLNIQKYATADSMITGVDFCYSIPIFTYQTTHSIIHPSHLYIHKMSKYQIGRAHV